MRRPLPYVVSLWVLVTPLALAAQERTVAQQIADVVRALPEPDRGAAAVWGYRDGAALTLIRPGTNDFICLADPQGDDIFQASCYHKDLEPFMSRGRELRAEGKNRQEVREIRGAEVEAGRLEMPQRASMTTIRGPIDPATGVPDSVQVLYVLYLPYATPQETGLPVRPGSGPWLMDPGAFRAHVMISGPKQAF